MSRRYIAVTADIFDHHVFADEPYSRRDAWLWLIANAAWKPHRVRMGNKTVELQRGQVLIGLEHLSGTWGWGVKKVRLFLDFLAAENMIEKGQSKGRLANIATVCKYEQFQTGKTIEGQVEDMVEGRFRAGSGQHSTKDTRDTNRNTPLPPKGGDVGQDQELPLPFAAQAPAKPKRAPKLNVAPEYTADFNEVWDAFPKNPNASKQDAFNAWNRIPAAERPSVLPACKVYAAEIEEARRKSRDGSAAISHLSSFLNKGTFRNKTAAKASSSPASSPFEHLATLTREEWKDRVCRLANGFWPTSELGPSPANKSCRVPSDLIRELDLADKYNEAGIAINKHHPNHPANRQHEAAP